MGVCLLIINNNVTMTSFFHFHGFIELSTVRIFVCSFPVCPPSLRIPWTFFSGLILFRADIVGVDRLSFEGGGWFRSGLLLTLSFTRNFFLGMCGMHDIFSACNMFLFGPLKGCEYFFLVQVCLQGYYFFQNHPPLSQTSTKCLPSKYQPCHCVRHF